ncbi:MAG: rod shape-determining protein MreC [Rhodobacteraceae bacterium]|nr:rod shape-determining protein MreC [Paracoccaceae bacterium]MCY4197465.1 rod shape-determining protein MreC [Paracoccaceae bacterium]
MDRREGEQNRFVVNVRRLYTAITICALVLLFLVWRVESERMERVRAAIVDSLLPVIEFGARPIQYSVQLAGNLGEHLKQSKRIAELEQEVAQLEHWRVQASLLQDQNAELRDLLQATSSPAPFLVTAQVVADTSSEFRHSAVVKAGSENGVEDGWLALDSSGLVGRVWGVDRNSARIILLADPESKVPVRIGRDSRGLVVGDGALSPQLAFVSATTISPGAKVVTSGDDGVFVPDIPVGEVVVDPDQIFRVRLLGDLWNLDFVTLRAPDITPAPTVEGELISPVPLPTSGNSQ